MTEHDTKLRLDALNVTTWGANAQNSDPLEFLHLQRFAREIIRLIDAAEQRIQTTRIPENHT